MKDKIIEIAKQVLESTTCCTITEEADIDDPQNYYYQHKDVLIAMQQLASRIEALLPTEEEIKQNLPYEGISIQYQLANNAGFKAGVEWLISKLK